MQLKDLCGHRTVTKRDGNIPDNPPNLGPLSTNGERIGDYHHRFESGKIVAEGVVPSKAYRELQRKQNKTKSPNLELVVQSTLTE